MVYIYVFELEQNKYYIGKTDNPDFRIESHINGEGSAWTKKYKPIKLLELVPNCDDYDEDKYTRVYMDKYGIDNVRGGAYVQIVLDTDTLNHLEKMSTSTNNKCFSCGQLGHFIKSCPIKQDNIPFEDKICCERCGRASHNKKQCYATKDKRKKYRK